MTEQEQAELLRRYEPIIKYTRGEQFFPMDAEAYIRCCSLWIKRPNEEPRQLIATGQLTPALLAEPYQDDTGTVRYLQFTEPLKATEMAAKALRRRRSTQHDVTGFNPGAGRLARVGYASRLVDALFSVSLLARGRVPGDLATAAAEAYNSLLNQDDRHIYHGRVVQDGDWTVLQYWFFYLYNNWRSGFNGANDHEADWEMMCIYLAADGQGELQPEWVAFASHDYSGDDLRRRWDDPEIQKVGDHAIIFAGAGSHGSYFSAGEYLTELELQFLTPLSRVIEFVRTRWRSIQATDDPDEVPQRTVTHGNVLSIPFVDYARGDGFALGPSQGEGWSAPCVISEETGWVRAYRGLWGLYTQDPFAGEDAPAGPMYNRDGSVRRAWFDPIGWAGLDKVSPRASLIQTLEQQKAALRQNQVDLYRQVQEKLALLRGLDVQAAAVRNQPHLQRSYAALTAQIEAIGREIAARQDEILASEALLESLERYGTDFARGVWGDARAHIRRAHKPAQRVDLRAGRVAELWAAISVTVLLLAFVVLFVVKPGVLPFWMATIVALFAFIEAGLRGAFTRVVGSFAVGLAVVAGLVLVYEFFWFVVGGLVLVLALYILFDNLRELLRPRAIGSTPGRRFTPPSE